MYFVKACSYSVHSLESLRSCVPTFVCILAHAEEENAQHIQLVEGLRPVSLTSLTAPPVLADVAQFQPMTPV